MRAHKEGPAFQPVVLTLESQAEVDALYALFNCGAITVAVGLDSNTYKTLSPYAGDTSELHANLCRRMK